MKKNNERPAAPEPSADCTPTERAVLEASESVQTIVLETLVELGSRWPALTRWADAVLALKLARRAEPRPAGKEKP